MIQRKSFPAQFKAVGDDGTFEAVVAVFGNVDLAGDRIIKGAFADNLKAWQESGDPIPVIWSHMWEDPDAHIGKVLAAEERDEGLWIKAQVDADGMAKKVHQLLKERRVREFSFAYDVVEEEKNDGANELLKLDIIEVGPTLKGMNPDTQLLAAKSGLMGDAFKAALETQPPEEPEAETKTEEKSLSRKHQNRLRKAAEIIGEVLAELEEDGKSRERAPGLSLYKTRIDLAELEDTA